MHVPMPHPPAPLAARDRVLLVRLGAVGDVLRTLPALHLIRTAYPSIHLAWIVEDLSRDLIEGHPEVDEVIRFPRDPAPRSAPRVSCRPSQGCGETCGRGASP